MSGSRFLRPQLVARRPRSESERAERFRQTILPHLDAAYALARYLTRDPTAAEDIVQDAFLRAFRGFETWRGEAPRAWLLAIVRNCFLTYAAARPSGEVAGNIWDARGSSSPPGCRHAGLRARSPGHGP